MSQGGLTNGGYGPARRNTPDGFNDLLSLGNGIMEQRETIYKEEEKQLFEVNKEMKDLIEQLERKDAEGKA